jgi:hypothetical protein
VTGVGDIDDTVYATDDDTFTKTSSGATAIGKIVTVNRGQHRMFDFHELNGTRYFFRFIPIDVERFSGLYTTKSAASRTDVSENHKSCGALAPAFTHIWAAAALANGVEFIFIYQSAEFTVIFSGRKFYADPFWLLY